MANHCVISQCGIYRYTWWPYDFCDHQPGRFVQFIGLNPSTADEYSSDPTVRRCKQFAKDWGYSGLCMTNLFAFRATDPSVMKAVCEPIGPDNNDRLRGIASVAGIVIGAWGTHGGHLGRDREVVRLLSDVCKLHYLRKTKDGFPGHPLYLPKTLKPVEWHL